MSFRRRAYDHYNKLFERRGRLVQPKKIPLRRPWLPDDKSAAILDLGCGLGETLLGLHTAGYVNLTGVDAGKAQLAMARESLPDEVALHQSDALEFLQTHKNQYGLIVAYDLLEHFTKDEAMEICDAVFSSLKSSGTFVIKVPNSGSVLGLFGRDIDFTHLTGYTDLSLFQLLDATGFTGHRLVETDRSINLRIWRPWKPLTGFGLRPRINIILHRILYWLSGTRPPSTFSIAIEAWTRKPYLENNTNT